MHGMLKCCVFPEHQHLQALWNQELNPLQCNTPSTFSTFLLTGFLKSPSNQDLDILVLDCLSTREKC